MALPASPRESVIGADSSAIKPGFITFADESLRFRGSGVRDGVRARHRHHHGNSHVPIARSPRVRLHRAREVRMLHVYVFREKLRLERSKASRRGY